MIQPKKSDKQIDGIIHKVCRNIKDGKRKAKKAEEARQAANSKKTSKEYEEKRKLNVVEPNTEVSDGRNIKKSKRTVKNPGNEIQQEIESAERTAETAADGDVRKKKKNKTKTNGEQGTEELKLNGKKVKRRRFEDDLHDSEFEDNRDDDRKTKSANSHLPKELFEQAAPSSSGKKSGADPSRVKKRESKSTLTSKR